MNKLNQIEMSELFSLCQLIPFTVPHLHYDSSNGTKYMVELKTQCEIVKQITQLITDATMTPGEMDKLHIDSLKVDEFGWTPLMRIVHRTRSRFMYRHFTRYSTNTPTSELLTLRDELNRQLYELIVLMLQHQLFDPTIVARNGTNSLMMICQSTNLLAFLVTNHLSLLMEQLITKSTLGQPFEDHTGCKITTIMDELMTICVPLNSTEKFKDMFTYMINDDVFENKYSRNYYATLYDMGYYDLAMQAVLKYPFNAKAETHIGTVLEHACHNGHEEMAMIILRKNDFDYARELSVRKLLRDHVTDKMDALNRLQQHTIYLPTLITQVIASCIPTDIFITNPLPHNMICKSLRHHVRQYIKVLKE